MEQGSCVYQGIKASFSYLFLCHWDTSSYGSGHDGVMKVIVLRLFITVLGILKRLRGELTGERAQRLTACVALANDLGSILSTHMAVYNHL